MCRLITEIINMNKVFFYPPAPKGGYTNPYIVNYKNAIKKDFNVLNMDNQVSPMLSLTFLLYSLKADIYIINWLESVCFLKLGILQFLLARLGLRIIKLRKKKIIWMFHNIHPHQGRSKLSSKIQKILFKQSELIITHSSEATMYAREKTGKKVLYKCHPVKEISVTSQYENKRINCDVFIWGTILPYKGVYEFISLEEIQQSKLKIIIVGECANKELAEKINSQCNDNIHFENRRASFDELAQYIQNSRYTLFPYIGDCVSSSGALIDTIVFGGTPVGPDVGAFKDLKKEDICLVYRDYTELVNIIHSSCTISETQRSLFIKANSWKAFSEFLKVNLSIN